MKVVKAWVGLAAAAAMLAPGAAQAQTLFSTRAPVLQERTDTPTTPAAAKFRRWQLGAGAAIWDSIPGLDRNPFAIPGFPPGSAVIEPDNASPLITADYSITRRLSFGAWYNPQGSEIHYTLAPGVFPGIQRTFAIGDIHSDQFDAHLTYNLDGLTFLPEVITRGLSLQAGYTASSHDVDFRTVVAGGGAIIFGLGNFGFTQKSGNVWINKSMKVGSITVRGNKVPVNLFGSGGYYFDDFGEDGGSAWQALGGFSLTLSDSISLGASYWLFDVGGANASRVSTGLTWNF